jgi:transcriptional regulator with XRE-family HTH domain
MRPLAAIRTHKQVSRASVAKALGLSVAKVEYFEEHAPLTTLEYLVNLKRTLGVSWSTVGGILEEAAAPSLVPPTPLRGRGRPRKNSSPMASTSLSTEPKLLGERDNSGRTALSPSSLKAKQTKQPTRTETVPSLQNQGHPPFQSLHHPGAPDSLKTKRPRGRPRKQPAPTSLSALLGLK